MANTPTATYGFNKPAQGDTPWATTINNDWDAVDTEIGKPRLPFNSPTVGATTTCDLSAAREFVFTVSQATTLAFTNVPSASFAARIRLLITNGSAFALTFPASVTWLAGIAPTFKASGVDEVELLTKDAGVTWYATLRNLKPGVIAQPGNLSTTSTSDVSLASYSLPANTLGVNGQSIRITMEGSAVTQQALPNIKFGATVVAAPIVLAGEVFKEVVDIARTGAATQVAIRLGFHGSGSSLLSRFTPTETLSGAVTIDVRGSVTAGGTLNVDIVTIELLARA